MNNTYSITFRKLMTAGYISAETYQFLSPKERLYELNVSEINSYKYQYKSELLPLFEDEDTYLTIAYMEKLETQLREGDLSPYELLFDCLREYPVEIESLVSDIGKKLFLQDYIYCTEHALKTKKYISNENIKAVISFRNKYRKLFQLNCSGLAIDDCKSHIANTNLPAQADNIEENLIESGEGFNSTDYVSIDEDAVSFLNVDCKKYVLFLYSLNKDQLDSVIDFLISLLGEISIRTRNGIKVLGYREFLINYLYAEPVKMLNIKNFGRKSLVELEVVKPKLIDYIKELYNNGNTESVEKSIKQEEEIMSRNRTLKERIGQDQYKLVTDLFAKLLEGLTRRSKNGIQAYKGDFVEDFVNRSNDIKSIKHIGRKSEGEITLIIEKLRKFIATLEERELSPEDLFWMKKKENYDILLDEFCRNYYSNNQVIPMLHILENCFSEIIKIRDINILNEITPFFRGPAPKTFNQVTEKYNLTKQGVVNNCNKAINRICNYYCENEKDYLPVYHKILSKKEDWDYIFRYLGTEPIWNINDFSSLSEREDCSLSVETISVAISLVFRDSYELIGKRPISITSSKTGWSNTFLINKSLTEIFDFEQMLSDLDQYQESSTEPLIKNAQELLNDPHFITSWKRYNPSLIPDLGNAITKILIKERGLIPDANLIFTIEGKMKEKPADVICRILSHRNEPVDLEELLNLLKVENTEEIRSLNKLNVIISNDSRICKVSYANKAALVEWGNIVIGNIRGMIVDFLSQFEEPQYLDDIADYIQSCRRDTNKNSIRTSMDNGVQFIRFDGGYYGLSDKTYPEWYYLSEAERVSRQKLTEFEDFIRSNRRFPFATSDDQAEELLYRWWLKLKRKNNNSDFIVNEIRRILQSYQDIPQNRTDYEWFKKCNEYEKFYSENRRKPGKANIYEKELAVWLEKALSDFSHNNLSPNKEQALVGLTKLF